MEKTLEQAPTGKRLYSRNELFRLGGLMREQPESMGEMLDHHRNFYERFPAATETDFESLPSRTFASFGRKRSDLGTTNRKLCRMSSSPQIKYNKPTGGLAAGELAAFQNLPSQVRAKYARLIETVSRSCNRQDDFPREPLSRQSSLNSTANTGPGSEAPARRPESLFGPLRRGSVEDPRKASEEPMSLPYSINTQPGARAGGKYNFGAENEEDDFDISNLLSITVLSDIRFIRQELSQAQSGRGQRLSALQRTKSHDTAAAKLPPRSRTSLDFQLSESRRRGYLGHNDPPASFLNHGHQAALAGQHNGQNQHLLRHLPGQQQMVGPARVPPQMPQPPPPPTLAPSVEQFNSLDETVSLPFNWHVNTNRNSSGFFVDPKVALEYHLKCSRKDAASQARGANQGSDAEERAKIIETFKAQLRARENDAGSAEATKKPAEVEREASAETKVEAAPKPEEAVRPGEPPKEQQAGAPARASSPEPQKATASPPKQAESEPTANQKTPSAPRASNIPRLVSLHRQSSAKQDEAASCQSLPPPPPAAKSGGDPVSAAGRANLKTGAKFVSQYKGLRGKSLADEVEESAQK